MPLQTITDTSSTLITFHLTSYCTTLPTYTGSDTTLTNKFDFAETVCSLIDHRWRQNVLKTKTWCTSLRRVCHWCFYNILTSFVIYYWPASEQNGIYSFCTMNRNENKDKLNFPLIALLLFEDLFQWDLTFSKSRTLLFVSTSSFLLYLYPFFKALVSEPALVKEEPDVLFWPDCTGKPIWETFIYSQWDTREMTGAQREKSVSWRELNWIKDVKST